MAEMTIAFGVTAEEYAKIQELARKASMSVPQFVKSKLVETDFSRTLQDLIERVKQVPKGSKFTIRSQFSEEEWQSIPKGVRLALGKQFYISVTKTNTLPGISPDKKDSANTMWYQK
jgi:hypothetical protein